MSLPPDSKLNVPDAEQRSPRVLIVDDDEDAADALQMTLECFGHDVDVARSGPDALQYVAASPSPAAALIDLALPVMDGFELARRLRATNPTTVLVALTGFADEGHREAAEQAGFDRYITKPITARELDELLRSMVGPGR